MLQKNDIVKVTVKDITLDGKGVCKVSDGDPVIFVPCSAIGDVLEVKILKVLKHFAFGKIEKVINPSDDRCENTCSIFEKCGGCVFRHISYDCESKLKERIVSDAINKIAKVNYVPVNSILSASDVYRYRNKAIFPIRKIKGKVKFGFFALNSHRIVPCGDCVLHPKEFFDILASIVSWIEKMDVSVYDEKTHIGLIRNVYIRKGFATDEIMVCVVINGKKLPHASDLVTKLKRSVANIKSVLINFNTKKTNVVLGDICETIFGQDYIEDELCGLKFRISPKSFYQINHEQTEVLYDIVRKFANVSQDQTVLDLYCGIGTIGLTLAGSCEKLVGVEMIPDAIANAKVNARLNGVTNAKFVCADAADFIKEIEKVDMIVLDPPRKGCAKDVLTTIANRGIEKIVYVSCNPATLARDVKILYDKGYELKKVQPVDMFPRTGHVEVVVLISRVES